MLLSPKKEVEPGPSMLGFDHAAIRHKTLSYQIPTLRTLHQELTEDIKVPGSHQSI